MVTEPNFTDAVCDRMADQINKYDSERVVMPLSLETLKTYLNYNPETGKFIWLRRPAQRIQIGDEAGTSTYGYIQIRVLGKIYKAHRLAWFYTHGEWPEYLIDHANGDRSDNRLCNLRQANRTQNAHNSKKRVGCRSKLKGVYFHKASGLWCARVTKDYKVVFCSYFHTEIEAHNAYVAAAKMVAGEFFHSGKSQRAA